MRINSFYKTISILLAIVIVSLSVTIAANAEIDNVNRSVFSWDFNLLSAENSDTALNFLKQTGINRIYQCFDGIKLDAQQTRSAVEKLQNEGFEIVPVKSDNSWGFEGNSLSVFYEWIDGIVEYNVKTDKKLLSVALDVEPYTEKKWATDNPNDFNAYAGQMKKAHDYAAKNGIKVIQIIPALYDLYYEKELESFITDCADEISIMNYNKSTALYDIDTEVSMCRKRNIPVECIFETQPCNSLQGITSDITYFDDGYDTLKNAENAIIARHGNIAISYHTLTSFYHTVTGFYVALISGYTTAQDPNIDANWQTKAVKSITLTGSDGSVITAGLVAPEYEVNSECYYAAYGIKNAVNYTASCENSQYMIVTQKLNFSVNKGGCIAYGTVNFEYKDKDDDGDITKQCSCLCHKNGFLQLVWQLMLLFYKLFGTNRQCYCGTYHY